MKFILGTFLTLVFFQICLSQNVNKVEFIGTLAIKGGEVLSYKVVFNQATNNEIKGYSITDFYGKNQTRTSIIGEYDTINNTLSFKELKNINTKMDFDDSTFCFVSTSKLKIRNVKGAKIINGVFKGIFPSGESCAEGTIYLVQSKLIEKIKTNIDILPTHNDNMIIVKDTIKTLRANHKLLIEQWSNKVSIEVWDGCVPDNDAISIYLNDKIFKKNITLTTQKEIIDLPATMNKFRLRIVALNEGDSGLNTLNYSLKNSYGEKSFVSILNKGESFEIEFREK